MSAYSSCGEQGYALDVVYRLLAVASLVVEYGLYGAGIVGVHRGSLALQHVEPSQTRD